jgi:hypothetical protein
MEQDVSLAGNAYVRRTPAGPARAAAPGLGDDRLRDHAGPDHRHRAPQRDRLLVRPAATEDREPAFYPVDEVAHWSPIPDPLANFRGMSWLTPVLREVDADTQMTDYKRAYLVNAATPNLLVKYSRRSDRTSSSELAPRSGASRRGRQRVQDDGPRRGRRHHGPGQQLRADEFAAVQAAGENRIAVAGGVPAIVVGLKEGLEAATYSNYEMAMRRFADLTMRPNWRSACAALAKLVDVPDDSACGSTRPASRRCGRATRSRPTRCRSSPLPLRRSSWPATPRVDQRMSLSAGDVTLLKHSGLVSVQMQSLQAKKDAPARSGRIAPERACRPLQGGTKHDMTADELLLVREFPRVRVLEDVTIRADGDGRTVEAYAAAFDTPAEIRDQDGHYNEELAPFVVHKTIADRGTNFGVFYNHAKTLYGTPDGNLSVPIGVPLEVADDERACSPRPATSTTRSPTRCSTASSSAPSAASRSRAASSSRAGCAPPARRSADDHPQRGRHAGVRPDRVPRLRRGEILGTRSVRLPRRDRWQISPEDVERLRQHAWARHSAGAGADHGHRNRGRRRR